LLDEQIQNVFEAIRELMTPPQQTHKEIGFHVKGDAVPYRTRRRREA
jgi:hypothetical protein